MKIIITHDVDHINWSEHWKNDFFISRWIIRNLFYFISGKIRFSLLWKRLLAVFRKRFNRIGEVMEFDRKFNIPSTFFVGLNSGLGMSYSSNCAKKMIHYIRNYGFEVGVHGIAYTDGNAISDEFERFKAIVGENYTFGVRNHYLRYKNSTLNFQEQAGYIFDTTNYGVMNPYKSGNIWEFPVCLMDSYLFCDGKDDFNKAKEQTLLELKKAEELNLKVFTIIFHDPHFSDLFPGHRAWYIWLIQYLKTKYSFVDFKSMIVHLEKKEDAPI